MQTDPSYCGEPLDYRTYRFDKAGSSMARGENGIRSSTYWCGNQALDWATVQARRGLSRPTLGQRLVAAIARDHEAEYQAAMMPQFAGCGDMFKTNLPDLIRSLA